MRRRKKTERKALSDKLDRACSRWIREAYDWTCANCGNQYSKGSQGLHWSHFWSRRHKATRWDPDNACAHCFSCHQRLGGDPVEFSAFIRNHLGDGLFEIVREKAMSTKKWTEWEMADLLDHIIRDIRRMERERDKGVTGYIKPEVWE